MSASARFTQTPLRPVLFSLLLLGGFVPLVMVDYLLISMAPRAGRLLETGAIVVVGALLLIAGAWILSGWAAVAVVEPLRRLSAGLASISHGRLETWVRPEGAVRELAQLSDELNRMSALTLHTVRRLEQSERDNAALASDAMRLFRQAVEAKAPMTKHHPGLVEAYSKAVARQLGEHATEFESSEIPLSPFTDPQRQARTKDTRAQPRYEVDDLLMQSPVGARILDVGPVGMGFETLEKLPVGRQRIFELIARSQRLQIPGDVAWCRLVRTMKTAAGDLVPVYRAGVRFAEALSESVRDELLEVIRTHRQVA